MPIKRSYRQRSLRQSVDWQLVICYVILVLIGWMNIYASVHTGYDESISIFSLEERSGMQLLWIGISFVIATLVLFVIPPRLYEGIAVPAYAVVLFLLVAVIFVGTATKGSHSWFKFGPVSFQPAEISKITTSLMLAVVMSKFGFKASKFKDLLTAVAIIAVPMFVIILENETGSALVYVGFIFMMYREGLSGWFIAMIFAAIVLFVLTLVASPYMAVLLALSVVMVGNTLYSGKAKDLFMVDLPVILLLVMWPLIHDKVIENDPESFLAVVKTSYLLIPAIAIVLCINLFKGIKKKDGFKLLSSVALIAAIILSLSVDVLFNKVLQDHQRTRIEVLLGMTEDPSGVGYNVNQSMIAIGSGGFTGKGYLQGTQNAGGFVPEQSTDFIFCTIGEEWGFAGCTFVILLYVFLIWRIISTAEKSRETFTRIYGYSIAGIFFIHLFINVGMTIGLVPVIGIPLPMISYGGSSLLAFTIMLFIFIALGHNERKYF